LTDEFGSFAKSRQSVCRIQRENPFAPSMADAEYKCLVQNCGKSFNTLAKVKKHGRRSHKIPFVSKDPAARRESKSRANDTYYAKNHLQIQARRKISKKPPAYLTLTMDWGDARQYELFKGTEKNYAGSYFISHSPRSYGL
jgi:hypothetical protein